MDTAIRGIKPSYFLTLCQNGKKNKIKFSINKSSLLGLGSCLGRVITNKTCAANLLRMQSILRGHRGSKKKLFLGVIGNYFVEILDDDPFITKFLAATKSKYQHSKSDLTRFLPPDERMVLRSHEKNSLVIFKGEKHLAQTVCSLKLFVYLHPAQTPKALLTDAMRLAAFRWSKIKSGEKIFHLEKSFKQPAEEILASLS